MSIRNLKLIIFKSSLLLVLILSPLLAYSEEDKGLPIPGQAFGDWIVRCNDKEKPKITCIMTQVAVVETSSERLMRINIAYVTPDASGETGSSRSTIQVTLPLGILLTKAPQLFLDDQLLRDLPIGICLADGCYSTFRLDADLLEQFLRMESGHIILQSGNGEFIKLPISGKGSRSAYNSMVKIATALLAK